MSAETSCSDYLSHPDEDRQQAAAAVSVQNQAGDAGNPMQYLNADQYCHRNPSATLSCAVGKSLDHYRSDQARTSAAAAPPSVKATKVNGVTHLSDVCIPGQQATKVLIKVTWGGRSDDPPAFVTANGKPLITFKPDEIDEEGLYKLVPVPCKGPVDVRTSPTSIQYSIDLYWPARPGVILQSADNTTINGPGVLEPPSPDEASAPYEVVMDS